MQKKVEIIQGDITEADVDAIVNAANERLAGGGGVDGAIHRAAGPELPEACRRIGRCPTGQAVITPGFELKAKHIIHTVGPVWHGGEKGEADALSSCYERSFAVARENGLRSIAFPAISTGVYGYPLKDATRIALSEAAEELKTHPDHWERIVFYCFDQRAADCYREVQETLFPGMA